MKITKLILDRTELKNKFLTAKIPANIASVFSVLFSLSIVVELSNIVEGSVMFILGIFTVIFLLLNERIKVVEIKKFYAGNKKAVVPFLITFMISLALSSIGIYFWVNKTIDIKNQSNTEYVTKIAEINKDYNNQINNLKVSNVFEGTTEYKDLHESLQYWKTRRPANLEERNLIRENIQTIESKISDAKLVFNTSLENQIAELKQLQSNDISIVENSNNNIVSTIDSNNQITIIFLIMIVLTELGIVILNKDVAKIENRFEELTNTKLANNYLIGRKVLISLYLSANKQGTVNMLQALYSPVINKLTWSDEKKWSETKKLYNMLINVGILSDGKVRVRNGKQIMYNNIELPENKALKIFDNYYDKILSL